MSFHGNGWRPTRITRFIKSFGTATAALRVETELGDGFLKALGNPEGPHALACELVGSLLAESLGLSTFDFSLIDVTVDDELPFVNGDRAAAGPGFIARAEQGSSWGGTAKELKALINPLEISGLVTIDTWTLNDDRYAPDGRRINRDNVFFIQASEKKSAARIVAMDFTHAFRHGQDINRKVAFIERIQDDRVYGRFPEFRTFLNRTEIKRLSRVLGGFTRATADDFVRRIPPAWEVDTDGRVALATLITERAHFLAQNLDSMLWPQLELEGGAE